jgi:serine/threonine protein kinase
MAQVIAIGEAVNDEERKAIAWLKEKLPDDYYVIHSFEVEQFDQLFEVDICVAAPHAIYLVDAKGVHGKIDVDGSTWHTSHSSYRSPSPKLRGNAKSFSGLIGRQNRNNRDLKNIYVDTAVLLTIDDCQFNDPEDRERGQVIALKNSTRFFTDVNRIPDRFTPSVTKYIKLIAGALGQSAKKREHGLRLGNWEVADQLQVNERFTEYRAFNSTAGKKGGTVLARAYIADPYLPEEERSQQKRLLENAYRALMSMPAHTAIIGAKDFFATEAQDQFILITDDIPGDTLSNHLSDSSKTLTLDQKKRVVRDLLSALVHLHTHDVVHRNITPEHLLMGMDGQPRLMDFDYARVGSEQTTTVADAIQALNESRYKAPELWADNTAASAASDLYSLGLVIYTLFTGEAAFDSVTQAIEHSCVFSRQPSEVNPQLPKGFDQWLNGLKVKDPAERPTAQQALDGFQLLWRPQAEPEAQLQITSKPTAVPIVDDVNYKRLPAGFALTSKYVVQQPLGKPGGFGIVYKVIDTLGDVPRAIKLILQDRESVLERLKQEYRTLVKLPEHPYVVKVFDADVLPNDGPPYIVFEYLEGHDVSELIRDHSLTAFEVWEMAKQVTEGLAHLHDHDVFHCDIKPQNLIWKDGKVRIIDFNVSVEAQDMAQGGGSRKYLPPDLDLTLQPQAADLIDRDLYALGITVYRAITGEYPWAESQFPVPGEAGRNPTDFNHSMDLSDEVCALLIKLIAPKRADRFDTAEDVLAALNKVAQLKKLLPKADESTSQFSLPRLADGSMPTKSAFHDYLLTLYSQSRHSNSGTRGLDDYAKLIYVDTALDTQLAPAVLAGELKLVLITGNAGDGKTAFLQQLEAEAERRGVSVALNPEGNGSSFEIDGHRFVSNYDGSQDEGDKGNDSVLAEFFASYQGSDDSQWPQHETRLIAINEGRLVDFLASHRGDFSALMPLIEQGLMDGQAQAQVAVVNLNLRDVLASSEQHPESIFERLIARMVDPKVWQGCDFCALKDTCYVRYNVATFQDAQSGPKVIERLKYLYSLTNLRNQLHITLRDLRSALAYTLVGGHSCAEIRDIYAQDDMSGILKGYYFNAWCGNGESEDRLLALLAEVDVADSSNVRMDRGLDYLGAASVDWLSFDDRGDFENQLLQKRHDELPAETSLSAGPERYSAHQAFVGMLRRKVYFELRGDEWRQMVVYRSAERLLRLLEPGADLVEAKQVLIYAINRGEGLHNPHIFNGQLAMQVRRVERGTVKSYRVFPADVFSISVNNGASQASFIERRPSKLVLSYRGAGGLQADLDLNLDLFEMLQRLNEGYIPSVEELQGYYLSLTVFKNVLASAPYQEVLLTTNGRHYQKISRERDGVLVLEQVKEARA